MAMKIMTMVEMKKNYQKIIFEKSIDAIQTHLINAVYSNLEFVDLPFNIQNQKDRDVFMKTIKAFKAKKWNVTASKDENVTIDTPHGRVDLIKVTLRFTLRAPNYPSIRPGETVQ